MRLASNGKRSIVAFGQYGNPTLETMLKVLPAPGLQLKFEPVATT